MRHETGTARYVIVAAIVVLAALIALLVVRTAMMDDDVIASDMSPTQKLERAWEAFSFMDTIHARPLFEAVIQSDAASEAEVIQALYGLGLCQKFDYPRPQPQQAVATFQTLLDTYPDSEVAPWTLLEIADIMEKEPQGKDAARILFEDIIERYQDSEVIHEATLRLASSYLRELDRQTADRGVEMLQEHLETYPDNPLRPIMLFRLTYRIGETYGDYEASMDYALKLGHHRMCDPFRWSQMYWYIAQVYKRELNQPYKAIPWYQRILDECPFDPRRLSAIQMIEEIQSEQK